MKFLIFISILLISSKFSSAHPAKIKDDRIIFRDDDVNDSVDDLRFDQQLRLLNDPKSRLLKSDNNTKEFLTDGNELQRLEDGKFYQGDIVLLPEQEEILAATITDDEDFPTRTGLISESYRWPRSRTNPHKVIVPYVFSDEYSYYDKIRMWLAMNDIEKYTCVEFKMRSFEDDFVNIKSGRGCSSNLGRIGGQQEVSLKRDGCMSRGTIIHELIHALGYDHMHSHSDRDKFVNIVWSNIDPKTFDNFEKNDRKKFSNFGTEYDLYSVMHYGPTAFSKNGRRTIVPKNENYRNVIGQRVGMSPGDANRINNMYNC